MFYKKFKDTCCSL